MEITLYNDRTLISCIPSSLLAEMESRQLIVASDKQTISFVGAIIHERNTHVFLPRGSRAILGADRYKYAALTMNVVEKYSRTSDTKLNDVSRGHKVDGELNLTLIKSILIDFQQNGIYSRRHKETSLNSGKPDWKKTVNRFLPYLTKKGAPVYLDYFSKRNRHNSDNEVSRIHADIIAYLDQNFAWWFTKNSKQRIAPELYCSDDIFKNSLAKISILKQELFSVYSDRDIRLINDLINFIEQTEADHRSTIIAGLRDFHFAWEAMLRAVCIGVVDLNSKLPKPAYIDTSEKSTLASGMLTDIILKDESDTKLAVVDAKYYAATNIGNSPHWSDIVKQLFYQKALTVIRPGQEISNHFVFPSETGMFRRIEMKDQVHQKNIDALFAPIQCTYICPLEVMNSYLEGKKLLSYKDLP